MSKKTTIKAKAMPSKRTLNLVIKEKGEFRLERVLPAVLLVLILAALFGKFAVLDRYAVLAEAESVLVQEQKQLEALRASYADFDEVQAEYNRYTYADFDRTIADRQDILMLLEKYVFPVSGMTQLSVSENLVTMTLTGMTFEEISTLTDRLEKDPLVDHVFVSNANYTDKDEELPAASLIIDLADASGVKGGNSDE